MHMQYSALIIENGKAREVECDAYTPSGAVLYLLHNEHIRKGAIVCLGTAFLVGVYLCK